MTKWDGTDDVFVELRGCIRHLVDDREFDRTGFVRLVELLHDLTLQERAVAYEYLLHETVNATSSGKTVRSRALGRLSDLVEAEPREVAGRLAPLLRAAG